MSSWLACTWVAVGDECAEARHKAQIHRRAVQRHRFTDEQCRASKPGQRRASERGCLRCSSRHTAAYWGLPGSPLLPAGPASTSRPVSKGSGLVTPLLASCCSTAAPYAARLLYCTSILSWLAAACQYGGLCKATPAWDKTEQI